MMVTTMHFAFFIMLSSVIALADCTAKRYSYRGNYGLIRRRFQVLVKRNEIFRFCLRLILFASF